MTTEKSLRSSGDISVGVKHDAEKIRVELLDPEWLFGVGKVLTYGAKKYASHNWRKGLEVSRCLGAALRHLFAYLAGEDLDLETGLSHLYHASCELMFASWLTDHRPDLDDRYKPEPAFTKFFEQELSGETPSEYAARLREEIKNSSLIDEHKAGIAARIGDL